MKSEEKIELVSKIIPELRQFRQALIAKDVGLLTEIKVHLLNGPEPTTIKISSSNGTLIEDSITK